MSVSQPVVNIVSGTVYVNNIPQCKYISEDMVRRMMLRYYKCEEFILIGAE